MTLDPENAGGKRGEGGAEQVATVGGGLLIVHATAASGMAPASSEAWRQCAMATVERRERGKRSFAKNSLELLNKLQPSPAAGFNQ